MITEAMIVMNLLNFGGGIQSQSAEAGKAAVVLKIYAEDLKSKYDNLEMEFATMHHELVRERQKVQELEARLGAAQLASRAPASPSAAEQRLREELEKRQVLIDLGLKHAKELIEVKRALKAERLKNNKAQEEIVSLKKQLAEKSAAADDSRIKELQAKLTEKETAIEEIKKILADKDKQMNDRIKAAVAEAMKAQTVQTKQDAPKSLPSFASSLVANIGTILAVLMVVALAVTIFVFKSGRFRQKENPDGPIMHPRDWDLSDPIPPEDEPTPVTPPRTAPPPRPPSSPSAGPPAPAGTRL